MDILKAKEQVILTGKKLSESGLIARTWGNVSVRIGEDRFAITASGRNYMTLSPQEVIEINMEALSYEGKIEPSSEKKVHREIYRLRDDAQFIIHTHQSNASAVAAMGLDKISLPSKYYPGIGRQVVCAGYGRPGSRKLCRNTAEAVADSYGNAVLMSNHGAVCWGRDYEEALQVAHTLESACSDYLEDLGVEPWRPGDDHYDGKLWNNSPIIMEYMKIRDELRPYLDDFAQLIGMKLDIAEYDEQVVEKAMESGKPLLVRGKGALCAAAEERDSAAVSMVIEKNCRAAMAAIGRKPIDPIECFLMRRFYLKKYSKRSK